MSEPRAIYFMLDKTFELKNVQAASLSLSTVILRMGMVPSDRVLFIFFFFFDQRNSRTK